MDPIDDLCVHRFDAGDARDARDALHEGWQAGVAAWAGVRVPLGEFANFVLERLEEGADVTQLRNLALADLYLACACARSDPAGARAFVEAFQADIDGVHRKAGASADLRPDFRQDLVAGLVLGGGQSPKIAAYRGRGRLRYWVRVVCARRLADQRRRPLPPEIPSSGVSEAGAPTLPSPADGPEAAYLRHIYRESFESAMASAFESLSDRHKEVLRYQVLDGMPTPTIATVLSVHRGTASRWIKEARQQLLWSTRDTLVRRFGVPAGELESVMRLLRSGIDLSVRRLLEPGDGMNEKSG